MQSVKEIKQTLLEARAAGLKYIELRNKARIYEQRLMSGKAIRYESDGSFHERNGNSAERSLCTAADYRTEADRAAKELSEPYIKAARLIFLVKDDKLRSVLDRYYLHCQSRGRIAREMGYTERWVKKLHGYALKKISENT